jgi:hypothetical protein
LCFLYIFENTYKAVKNFRLFFFWLIYNIE